MGTNSVYHTATNTGGNFSLGLDNSTGSDFASSYAGVIWHGGAYPIIFATNNVEKLRLFASGGLSLGSTTDPGAGNFQLNNASYIFGKTSGAAATRMIGINSGNSIYIGSIDAAIASIILTNNGVSQAVWDNGGNLTNLGTIKTGGYTVATLPTGVTGASAYVTNALSPVFGSTVVGGGAVTVPVFYNGSNWIVG